MSIDLPFFPSFDPDCLENILSLKNASGLIELQLDNTGFPRPYFQKMKLLIAFVQYIIFHRNW